MGQVKIRHYVTRKAWPGSTATWGYWSPTKKMKAAGFKLVCCGEDGPEAWAVAERWNEKWDKHRSGEVVPDIAGGVSKLIQERYPDGSVGFAYQRVLKLREAEWKKKKIVRTKEQIKRDDWPRAWKYLKIFGDCDPKTITPEMFLTIDDESGEASGLLVEVEKVSVTERHRVVKIWRALWKKMVAFRYCSDERGPLTDPSLLVANSPPQPRTDLWQRQEILKRVQIAWRTGKHGLAACIAVAWDSMLSPVDARTLSLGQLRQLPTGQVYFELERAKTGKAAAATLSQWSLSLLNSYIAELKGQGIELLPAAPIFRTPGAQPGPKGGRRWAPRPYTQNQLGKDFRPVRAFCDPKDERQIADMRRSGAVEGMVGGATASDTSNKMANTLMASARLQKTYTPVHVASVLRFDEARKQGSKAIRKLAAGNEGGSKS